MSSTKPLQSLIVGVDPGGRSDEAARAAIDLFRRFEPRLELVHAVDIPSPEDVAGMPMAVATAEAEILVAAGERTTAHLEELFGQESFDARAVADVLTVLRGHPAKVLLERAEAVQADLILLGPHEKRGFLDFGSTARAVLAQAHCDIWVQPETYHEVKKVLVPLDLSDDSFAALRKACSLAEAFGASVTALHCFQSPEFAYAASPGYPMVGPTYAVDELRETSKKSFGQAMDDFEWGSVEHHQRFDEGHPVEAILEAAPGFDLIAMGSHGRTGLSRAVLGNVAYGVLKRATVPVLAMRQPERKWLL